MEAQSTWRTSWNHRAPHGGPVHMEDLVEPQGSILGPWSFFNSRIVLVTSQRVHWTGLGLMLVLGPGSWVLGPGSWVLAAAPCVQPQARPGLLPKGTSWSLEPQAAGQVGCSASLTSRMNPLSYSMSLVPSRRGEPRGGGAAARRRGGAAARPAGASRDAPTEPREQNRIQVQNRRVGRAPARLEPCCVQSASSTAPWPSLSA
ncbi:hypothetical protein EYF80_062113 [Liparis tanakae]|uniref:Uncharacterized protein n=1 Tax=Liparis tanakae TaxID=230148 RepID=A0A4Z2EGS3_9TELE|nr:hypothetical protein EYF80_062113 [Liparis tanakae]